MKIRVVLKDPDTMHDAVADQAAFDVKSIRGASKQEMAAIATERSCEAQSIISQYFMKYGEYLDVEFDTEALTATVIPHRAPR